MTQSAKDESYSAWNPGVEPDIPHAYRELETIYDPANVFTTLDEINHLVSDTGLAPLDLINFRPHRLVLHELLVRITADIVVLEGETVQDLGFNFRDIAVVILEKYLQPQLPAIEQEYQAIQQQIKQVLDSELAVLLEKMQPAKAPEPTLWQKLLGKKPKAPVETRTRHEIEFELINEFKDRARASEDKLESLVLRSLHKVLSSIVTRRGFIGNDPEFLSHVCVLHANTCLCSLAIGKKVGEIVDQAIDKEGFPRIPDADKPVLFSLKGASASGKSSLRPMLRRRMTDLGIDDYGYGIISPDIWRKQLLDYDALGESYKYAGRFTSHEVSIVDGKLDRYIRDKSNKRKSIPHLVVDRFRFDSFASEKIARILHNTYARYIDTMYMFFIVTPPEDTVERGWQRGIDGGRYKSVEDYLGHCVEAYSGMPRILFKWLAIDRPKFYFEFLDNSVPKGTYPRLIAKGTQGSMQIYDLEAFINIDRYKRIDIQAKSPSLVTASNEELGVKNNLTFLNQCLNRIKQVEFIDADSSTVYLKAEEGKFEVSDRAMFDEKIKEPVLFGALEVISPELVTLK